MALILAIANEKGGCGKTTTAMNLAGGLIRFQYRVLVVDADPQASATAWSIARGQNSLPFEVVTSRSIKGNFRQFATSEDYDIVLVDCPPGVADPDNAAGRVARAAIREADAVLVPLRPSTLDFSSATNFVRYLSTVHAPGQRVLVFINGRQAQTVLAREAAPVATSVFAAIAGSIVLRSTIGQRIAIGEVSGSGKTIFQYAPGSPAALEYTQLTEEIIQCLAQHAPTLSPSLPTGHSHSLPATA